MFLLVRSLHILSAFWYVGDLAGCIGMRLTMVNTSNLKAMRVLLRLQHAFEKYLLIPGGAALVIFGLLTVWHEQWPRFALEAILLLLISVPFVVASGPRTKMADRAFAEALRTGTITSNLRTAVRDKVLFVCESATVLIVLLILLLMLIKPA